MTAHVSNAVERLNQGFPNNAKFADHIDHPSNFDPTNDNLNLGKLYLGGVGPTSLGTPSARQHNFDGLFADNINDDLIYHRVWVSPFEIDGGFITEETEHDVKIWNANLESVSTISDITTVLPTGTNFSLVSTPVNLGIDEERVYIMVIEQNGPPIQDTYYRITIDGEVYEIYVHGIRVIPVNWEPEWSSKPKMRYIFQTAIGMTPTFVEQRRAITNRMVRESLIRFIIQNSQMQKLINTIMYGKDKVFGVPIVAEPSILSSAVSAGALTLPVDNDTTDYWNLNNLVEFILIVNYEDDIFEIKELDSVAANSIVSARGLINDYDPGTVVYPCFFASLKALSSNSITDNTERVNIEFREFILGTSR